MKYALPGVLIALAGAAFMVFGIAKVLGSEVDCDGEVMRPDEICVGQGDERTFDQMRNENRIQYAIMAGAGAGIGIPLGTFLAIREPRRRRALAARAIAWPRQAPGERIP